MRIHPVAVLPTATVVVWFVVAALSHAAIPTFWHVSTGAEFLKGEVEDLSINEDGRLVLGPRTQLVHETTAPFLWTLIAAPGNGLWAGSGNDGKVIRVAADGTASTFFDADELEVHALAAAPAGGLYVGTSPDGKIYKVEADGSATTFFDPEEKYIWALVVDAEGHLFAATGDKGTIYKITPGGDASPFYRTNANHVLSLAVDARGNVLAGTEAPGQVFRIDPDGQAFVLLDSPYREIRALKVDRNGVIYAAALNGSSPAAAPPAPQPGAPTAQTPVPTVSVTTANTRGGVSVSGGGGQSASAAARQGGPTGVVYRIAPDGVWDIVWRSNEDSPYDVTFDAGGALVIGTGGKGRIYRVTGKPSQTVLLTRAPAQQVTMFLQGADGQNYYATANPGKIFKLSSDRVEDGYYESDVLDARTVAAWGVIRWRASTPGGTGIQLFTRSGNTSTPNDIWSPWSAAYTNPSGEQITSPKARYLQWKAALHGGSATPILTSVTAAYLPRNVRPVVSSITVSPPGTVFQEPFSSRELEIAGLDTTTPNGRAAGNTRAGTDGAPQPSTIGRRTYRKGIQTFMWKTEDPNDDQLRFEVLYRREDETQWRTLAEGLEDSVYAWNTTSVPDGTYVIKVAASDAMTNSPGDALVGERESTAFDIDNSPPRIEVGPPRPEGERTRVPFTVTDAHSPVQHVEYSLDANAWQALYPMDGISDSRTERFEIVLEQDVTAERIIIRASDTMGNLTTAAGRLRD